jgi:hypothetical protein
MLRTGDTLPMERAGINNAAIETMIKPTLTAKTLQTFSCIGTLSK